MKTRMKNALLCLTSLTLASGIIGACTATNKTISASEPARSITSENTAISAKPADVFDLSHWSITVPIDADNNGKADVIDTKAMQTYSHADFFYLDDQKRMVFTSPNKGTTTPNSSNSRSELRYESRGFDYSIKTKSPKNNWAIAANSNAEDFSAIGGKLEASLHVDHTSLNAGYPSKKAAYSVVVGQIHGVKVSNNEDGFGYGNEPLKIAFKKWPEHEYGSIYWNYERNLPKEDPNRRDISYVVWGNAWDNPEEPGETGIALGEEFSYTVNVYQNTMYLTFENARHETVEFEINLSDNVDAQGKVDELDNPNGYTGDQQYFKAGAYNQCSTKDAEGMWYTKCAGTGVWAADEANGDFARVTFSKLVVSESHPQ